MITETPKLLLILSEVLVQVGLEWNDYWNWKESQLKTTQPVQVGLEWNDYWNLPRLR